MGYIVGGLVAIVLVVWVASLALGAMVSFGKAVGTAGNNLTDWWLGRRRLGVTAYIPEALREGSAPLPKTDPEKEALASYKPEPAQVAIRRAVDFESTLAKVFENRPAPLAEIEVERVAEILLMPKSRPYEAALAILSNTPHYSIAPPTKPQEVATPPLWKAWQCPEFEEPSFKPPLWNWWLSFLNPFVEASHRGERRKVDAALFRKDELLEDCEKRNKVVASLAEKASRAYARAVVAQDKSFAEALALWEKDAATYMAAVEAEKRKAEGLQNAVQATGEAGLLNRIKLMLEAFRWPRFAFPEGETRFDAAAKIIIHEHRFPDLGGVEWVKWVQLKAGPSKKPATQREKKDAAAKIYPSLCLRLAAEIARLDDDDLVNGIAINGWADYVEKTTGRLKRAYCASLFVTKEQILSLNLAAVDPLQAFTALKGIAARSLELTPVAPILRLDMNDPRFIDPKTVLANMATGENIAAMDWEDFEHLCRELFERAFVDSGAQVKVTQASRDQGVDAVVFDPDPLRGGKIVIQAKRYTNTVDVSAVRDLYGAVINEGAVKGILVTTSHFGPDAYSFAKDKPLTLLNGGELLGLLEKHGYKFRIDLAEAKAKL